MSPHTWGPYNEVNEFVGHAAAELADATTWSSRRHRTHGPRSAPRAPRSGRSAAVAGPAPSRAGAVSARAANGPPVLAVGQGLPLPRGPRPRAAPVPLDLSRTLEELLSGVAFDVVHVHDPYAPSASSIALRHSRSLNVGSFHEPTERILSTQVARPLVEIFFGRLDSRTASSAATGDAPRPLLPRRLHAGGAGRRSEGRLARARARGDGRSARIAFCAVEERGAMRLFLRALRRIDPGSTGKRRSGCSRRIRRQRASRGRSATGCTSPGRARLQPAELIAGADVLVLASGGPDHRALADPRGTRCRE